MSFDKIFDLMASLLECIIIFIVYILTNYNHAWKNPNQESRCESSHVIGGTMATEESEESEASECLTSGSEYPTRNRASKAFIRTSDQNNNSMR